MLVINDMIYDMNVVVKHDYDLKQKAKKMFWKDIYTLKFLCR